jgi:hypothetical protein
MADAATMPLSQPHEQYSQRCACAAVLFMEAMSVVPAPASHVSHGFIVMQRAAGSHNSPSSW